MSSALHKAIEDALASSGYLERGILINKLLEATSPVHVNEELLYRAIYTILRALPERLVPGTTLDVATSDLPGGGIEIFWEGKERLDPADAGKDIREILGGGPHGDLVKIALIALENYCNVHAGYVDTHRALTRSSSFERPAHIIRRVLAVIPGDARGATPLRSETAARHEPPASGPPPPATPPLRSPTGPANRGRLEKKRPRFRMRGADGEGPRRAARPPPRARHRQPRMGRRARRAPASPP